MNRKTEKQKLFKMKPRGKKTDTEMNGDSELWENFKCPDICIIKILKAG